MVKSFTSPDAVPAKEVPFELDGDAFTFVVPKNSVLLMRMRAGQKQGGMGTANAVLDWLEAGLTGDEWDLIESRLEDPDDPLDVQTVVEVTKWLIGEATGRPTG